MNPRLLTAIIFFVLPAISFSQAGTLDSSFGVDGKVLTKPGDGYCIIIQSDKKIVVGGAIGNNNFGVIRYNSDGSIDSTFGNSGIVNTYFPYSVARCEALTVQADGKIVAAGFIFNSSTISSDIALVRYTPNGLIDSSFGINGIIITGFGNHTQSDASSIKILPNHKLLVGGFASGPYGFTDFAVLRYNSNGDLDSTFGINGIILTDLQYNDRGGSIALQADGKILQSGSANTTAISKFAMTRYNLDGTLDTMFGTKGKVIAAIDSANDYCFSINLETDRKIVLSGISTSSLITYFALAKYNADGSLDTTFGVKGKILTNFDGGDDETRSCVVQNDGKILVAGFTGFFPNENFALARYLSTGSLDSSFGINGLMTTDFQNQNDIGNAIAIQSDEKIIIAGFSDSASLNFRFALARYNNDAILPVNFTSFTATKNNQSVILNWNTCNEINNKGFYIERSSTNLSWENIGFVSAKDLTKGCNDYSFTDSKPLPGNNFYRIEQVDKDGKVLLSKTVNIIFKNSSVTLSPNPAKNILTIKGLGNNNSVLYITDASGKSVSRMQTVNDAFNWSIQNLPAGNYFLVISQNNKTITSIKFIKQ
jgi:uncharacterized delta-60 repeat protein